MKQLVIDRLDGKYAICTDSDQKFYAIELPEVPQGAKAGSVPVSYTHLDVYKRQPPTWAHG